MSQVKTILCPTDWSQPSRVALQAAVNMALHEEAELVLLHVLPPLGMVRGIASVAPLEQMIQEEASQKLSALIAECVPPDVRVKPLIRFGDEADEIHLAALKADVVVVSTHGRAGWGRWAFGSVAERVLTGAECPIYVVGPKSARDESNAAPGDGRGSCFDFPYRQVLWPTDWSEPSERALDEAIAISRRHGAQLLMLHVIEAPEASGEGWKHRQRAEVELQFRELRGRKNVPTDARHFISRGDAAPEIIRVGLSEGADLVVMSTHGRTGWQRLTLGSVAQQVLRHVPCPVFLVPHPLALSGFGEYWNSKRQ